MVRATYRVNGDVHTLTVIGHANYAPYGKDIVCAGVSALVQALIGWIEYNYYKAECISVDHNDSEVIVSCAGGDDVAAVFKMAYIGLAQLSDCYQDYVEINTLGLAE